MICFVLGSAEHQICRLCVISSASKADIASCVAVLLYSRYKIRCKRSKRCGILVFEVNAEGLHAVFGNREGYAFGNLYHDISGCCFQPQVRGFLLRDTARL